jgi:transposase
MSAALVITRIDPTSATLRALSVHCTDAAQVRRMLALAMAMEGRARSEAASLAGMDRQTLCDWVHRYNASGIEGLKSRLPPGRSPALTHQQKAEFREIAVNGPDAATDEVVRWRCVDLQAVVARRFSVTVHVHTIGKWLNQFGLRRLQPRPVHPKKDPVAEVTFKRGFARLARAALLGTTAATPIEVWFQDEARVGQQGTHAYIWAEIGSRPLMLRDNRRESAYLFGAICPDRAVGAAMITPAAKTEAMNLHLEEISTQIAADAHALLVCDGAGWHQRGKQLMVPANMTLLTLPAYCPELNPMENVWDYLRQNKLCARVWDSYEDIVEACKTAWHFLINDPARIRSLGHRGWACVNV